MTFCEIFPPDNFPLYFYRYPIAPDLLIEPDDPAAARRSGTPGSSGRRSPACRRSPSRGRALRGLGGARPTHAHHPRPRLPADVLARRRPRRREQVGKALEHVTVAVGNREECEVAVGETDPQRAADALLERGLELAIVKQGPKGVLAATAGRAGRGAALPGRGGQRPRCRRRLRRRAGPRPARRLGPAPRPWSSPTSRAPSSPSRLECSTAMPDEAEVEHALASRSVPTEAADDARARPLTRRRSRPHRGPRARARPHRRRLGGPAPPPAARRRRPAAPRRRRPPRPRRPRRARRRHGHGQPQPTCSSGSPPRSPARASTACSARRTSSTTCC